MSSAEGSNLPSGWYATEIAGCGVDLRLSAPRGPTASVIAILAILAGWKTLVQWNVRSPEAVTPWMGLTLFLTGLALWIAFGMKYGISSKTAWCIGSALTDGITRAVIRTQTLKSSSVSINGVSHITGCMQL